MTRATCKWILFLALALSTVPQCFASSPPEAMNPHAKLDQILRQPAYNTWRLREQSHWPSIDSKLSTSVSDRISNLFHEIGDFFEWLLKPRSQPFQGPPSASGEGLSTLLKIFAWVIVVAIVVFLVIILIRILGNTAPKPALADILSREQVRAAMESGDALAMGSVQWMDEARRLAQEQDFRAVYRAMYLALLSGLHAAGKIEHHRNRTNWIYVQHYRGPVPERQRFSELTELFDRVWYGRKRVEDANLQQLQLDVDLLTRREAT